MKRNCRFFIRMMILGMMIFSFSSKAYAVDIDVLACPEGCNTLAIATYLSQEIPKVDPDMNLKPIATEGYMYNLSEMGRKPERWKTTIFGTNDYVPVLGKEGGKEPFAKFLPEAVHAKFRLLYGALWSPTGHFFITLDPKLKSFSDLKGKKLGVGLLTQSDWVVNPLLSLKYGHNVGSEDATILHLNPGKLAKALLDKEADAIVAGLGSEPTFKDWLPSAVLSELKKSDKPLYYIGQEPVIADKLNEKLGTSYFAADVPAGTLPGQKEVLRTIFDKNYYACHESFLEDLAYKLIKFVAKFGPKARFEAGIWQTWSPEMMVAGLSEENTHPGAIRAYKELGWWELTKKFKPVNLPR